jgi:hypothetical protein
MLGFGLCPLYGILRALKNTAFQKLDLLPSSLQRIGDTYSVVSVRKI